MWLLVFLGTSRILIARFNDSMTNPALMNLEETLNQVRTILTLVGIFQQLRSR